MFRVQQHFVSHSELHVRSVSLVPVLPNLQQRPHFHCRAAHEGRSGLAGPSRGGRVLACQRV